MPGIPVAWCTTNKDKCHNDDMKTQKHGDVLDFLKIFFVLLCCNTRKRVDGMGFFVYTGMYVVLIYFLTNLSSVIQGLRG